MRHETLLGRRSTALVLIDFQEKILPAMHDPARALNRACLLARGTAALGVPVVATEQYPRGLGPTVADLLAALPQGATPLAKTSFSAAQAPGFLEALSATGAAQVLLAGIETHICVLQTALDLAIRGYQVHLAADACGSRDPANHENALRRLERAGVVVTNAESALFEMLEKAEGPEFKEISRLVR